MRYILILLIASVVAFAGTIQPELQRQMLTSFSTDLIPVFILVQGELDTEWIISITVDMTRAERQQFVVDALKERAEISQKPVLFELESFSSSQVANIHTLWLANSIYCEATQDVIRQMANRSDVTLVERGTYENSGLIEPVEIHSPSRTELDKGIAWGVTQINADDVWALGYDGTGVIVGVIDTGTDYNHLDLENNMWHDSPTYHYGYDFYDNDYDPMDTNGHGSHCSGTVCGDGTNGTQTGVAPGATLMALRINYYSGGEYTWIQAMEFGADHGASVLSMSLGSGAGNTTLRTAEENLLTAGVYHSVAAGNSGPGSGTVLSSGDSPPPWFHPDQTCHGGQSAVITVGATDNGDTIASFSSRGPVTVWSDYSDTAPYLIDPDISGPGVNIVSTEWGGGYTTMSGTSMATPHLAGVAALIIQGNPSLSVAQIDSIIEVTSVDLGSIGKDNDYGAGRVDALAAFQAALSVGIADGTQSVGPAELLIGSINPNPVHDLASFEIYTTNPGIADISVFDISGRRIAIVSSEEIAAGTHAYSWIVPETISNGIYFVRSIVNGSTVSSRMTIIK